MSGRNFYLLTALPALGDPGAEPPLSLTGFLQHLLDAPKPRREAEALFLGDDLRQREAVLAGEIAQPEPAVLTLEQARGDEPLPATLSAPEDPDRAGAALPTDAVWVAYYRCVAALARRSAFLAAWVPNEVGLRNALASARAKALGLDAERYLVAPELAAPEEDFTAALGEWSAAGDPLTALRALDAARWAWLVEHDRWFSFADDELDAYAAKLMLLHRWKRIVEAERATAAPPGRS